MRYMKFFLFLLTISLLITGCVNDNTNDKPTKTTSGESIEADSFLRIHFIYAGQADATLLQLKENDELINILIDAGDWKRNDVLTYLQNEEIDDIDLIAITHPHADHIGQLDIILESLNVGEVWMNGDTNNSQSFANALEAIEKSGVDYYEPTAGESFEIGSLTIDVIHPTDSFTESNNNSTINNNSIVMRVQYKDTSFLFTGDAEREAEREMLASDVQLNADILHVGHHGSKTSSSEEFLDAVNAEIAIYSAGIDNSYGLPSPETIERLNQRHRLVYGTDKYGTIILNTDGKSYHISTEEEGILPSPVEGNECVNINTASKEDLQKIIHIGENSAEELIKLRPYESLNELIEINGIGEKRLEDIKEQKLACVGG